ncbi:MAG: alpha/beta hydrolase [Vulcanimicrobiaceae bacterium]|jgi:pimeloyl-ACP methyl ester carboxylesterase
MQTIPIDGGTLSYADDGTGHAVILIHGFLLDHSIWDGIVPALTPRARVIRPDLRGLGRSSVTPGPYLIEALAADIAALLDANRIASATVVGHSLGGYVALAFFRMFRERVDALGLVGSRFVNDTEEAARDRYVLADRAERDGIAPVVDAFIPRFFAPAVYKENPQLIEEMRQLCGRTDPHGAAAHLRGAAQRVDARDLVDDIDVPFLFAIGDQDAIMGYAEALDVVPRIPSAQLATFAGCGHMPMYEAADQLADALGALLESAGTSAAVS